MLDRKLRGQNTTRPKQLSFAAQQGSAEFHVGEPKWKNWAPRRNNPGCLARAVGINYLTPSRSG
jgi:hypothetical protein